MSKLHPAFRAQEFPHKPAYIMASSGQVVTYGELDQRSNQIAHLSTNICLTGATLKWPMGDPRKGETCMAA